MNTVPYPLDRQHLAASWRSWTSNELERVGPAWLQWVWTLAFSAVLAVFFTVLGAALSGGRAWRFDALAGWVTWYGKNLVVCFIVAATIHLMFDAARMLLGPGRIRALKPWQRSLFFAGIPLLGVAVGWPIGLWASGSADLLPYILRSPTALTLTVMLALGISLSLHLYFAARTREIEAEKRATEARLRLLQGQIEPHFLFNTLAGVSALIEPEPARAKAMLQAFTEHLRGVLGALRDGDVPLQTELDLAAHYLRLMGFRMEDRLRWELQAEPGLGEVPVPPLLLQPLIENAIVHGLEPALDGGSVRIGARRDGAMVELVVQDDGVGLEAARAAAASRPRGHGVALANIRQRLLARYGTAASLVIEAKEPGTRAVLRLPLG